MPRLKYVPLTREDVKVSLSCEPEDTDYREHFSYDNKEDEEATFKFIQGELDKGNTWGWCTVFVHVTWGEFTVAANIGACSYESEKDFRDNSGHYEEMVDEALDELNKRLEKLLHDLEGRVKVVK